MSRSAVKPDVFMTFSGIGKQTISKVDKKEQDPDDVALHSLETTKGWEVLRGYIERMKAEMDGMVASLIASGGNFEDIGKITVVSNLAKEKLDAIIQRVTDARDAIAGE